MLLCFSDVDECAVGNQCSDHQTCTNVLGSYTCNCEPGYRADPNQNLACLGKEAPLPQYPLIPVIWWTL